MSKRVQDLFKELGGTLVDGMPVFDESVHRTAEGTPYLTQPGIACLSRPHYVHGALRGFLSGFDAELGFMEYLDDVPDLEQPGAAIAKTAGQLCYMSFGPKRTRSDESYKYLGHIKEARHGSVLEHPAYTVLVYGGDRAFTHELVRHRVGVGFSQVSQRYVDGKTLRFVERSEYQGDDELHGLFEHRIDRAAREYDELARVLMHRQAEGAAGLSAERKTDLRKKVNQAARSSLPNETEAPVMFSFNARALRHVLEMRAASAADTAIRAVAFRLFLCQSVLEPTLLDDYDIVYLPDGTCGVETKHRKV